nr:hypothetical protein [Brevibacillus laterosporus]
MKKNLFTYLAIIFFLTGCSNNAAPNVQTDQNVKTQEVSVPVTEPLQKPQSTVTEPAKTNTSLNETKIVKTLDNGVVETTINGVSTYSNDPQFRYYKGANWEDNYDGLITKVERIALADSVQIDNETTADIVNAKFILTNTTQNKFTTYPDQARLVTSTGEQIEMPIYWTKAIGGEIDKGVTKESVVYWKLDRGNVDKLEWVKLKWATRKGPANKHDSPEKEYEIEIKVPQKSSK